MRLKYNSFDEIANLAEERKIKISKLAIEDEALSMGKEESVLFDEMARRFDVMCESVRAGMDKDQKSMSGLTGGEGYAMHEYAAKNGALCGDFMAGAMARALAVAGHNASMGRIVAAPTAGSCGILPGCLVSLYEDRKIPKEDIVMSMFTAGAVGMVIANKASLAGAQGGCQAECGSAASMAAAALAELMGGSPGQCADAAAMAVTAQMGLVCDPVAGLVEIPCIKRNVSGLVIAFSSADMALAGIKAHIPMDECVDAMREVGDAMSPALRETAVGGLAATPTGMELRKRVFGE
ncbi:MAG: L-serine ammonia-lyase, iron-sulfur-dependent, subunit alpha [Lachnospiraceae bacterium]|nr:L-serine ammonia-lyase, iron-sulfur-dependent, subunit alpha [Lachnospiraceae bacterium]